MRQIIIKLIVLCLFLVTIFTLFSPNRKQGIEEKVLSRNEAKKKKVQYVEVSSQEGNKKIELEEYLLGVVASEMPYTFEMEALKAQSVAARTFVMQRALKVDDTTSSQVYKSELQLKEIFDQEYDAMHKRIQKAVQETKAEVMKYQGQYISALFYSCSNGKTNDASWYYQNETPYLKSVDSKWDANYEAYKKAEERNKKDITKALGISNFTIGNYEYYDNGYVKSVSIGGKKFSGREVREKLKLRSSCFSFVDKGDILIVNTLGFGHGVGMSQYGADGMAKEGKNYIDILKHYYQGIQIEKING